MRSSHWILAAALALPAAATAQSDGALGPTGDTQVQDDVVLDPVNPIGEDEAEAEGEGALPGTGPSAAPGLPGDETTGDVDPDGYLPPIPGVDADDGMGTGVDDPGGVETSGVDADDDPRGLGSSQVGDDVDSLGERTVDEVNRLGPVDPLRDGLDDDDEDDEDDELRPSGL